jgi:hypothetical protein
MARRGDYPARHKGTPPAGAGKTYCLGASAAGVGLGFEEWCFEEDECFFLVVVVDEDVAGFGVAAGAGAADCWAKTASGKARASADRVTFFISSPFRPGTSWPESVKPPYAPGDERSMNARG